MMKHMVKCILVVVPLLICFFCCTCMSGLRAQRTSIQEEEVIQDTFYGLHGPLRMAYKIEEVNGQMDVVLTTDKKPIDTVFSLPKVEIDNLREKLPYLDVFLQLRSKTRSACGCGMMVCLIGNCESDNRPLISVHTVTPDKLLEMSSVYNSIGVSMLPLKVGQGWFERNYQYLPIFIYVDLNSATL